ncbi:MAG: acyltransferase [Lachnospiraceae bacterium]|nr:acyltransferase [Lachnospiraceae bacterium]
MSKTDNKQIGWINTLKGIACWVVFLGHYDDDYPYIPGLQKLYDNGALFHFLSEKTTALNIFYVISAFLVAYSFREDEEGLSDRVGKGVLKRYFRLALPVLFCNFVIILIQVAGFGFGNELSMFEERYTVPAAIWNAFVAGPFFGSSYFNPNMWMLNELFIGYVFAVITCVVIKGLKKNYADILLAVLTVVLWLADCYLSPFVFGVFIYRVISGHKNAEKNKILGNLFGCVMVVVGCLISSYCRLIAIYAPASLPENPYRTWWHYCWIAAMLLFTGIAISPLFKRILELGFLPKLGRICFPVYLFHRIWMASFGALAFSYGYGLHQIKDEANMAAFVTCVLLTVVSSVIYVLLIEPPINKLTDRIIKKTIK